MAEVIDNLSNMISDVNKAENAEMLMRQLEKIGNYADEQTTKIIESGDYELVRKFQEMVTTAYDKAAEMIETNSKFSELKNFTKSFRASADYWRRKTKLSKTEIIERLKKTGNDLQNQGKYQESIELFDKATKIDPNDSKSWLDMGISFSYMGLFSKAINCYDKAIKIDQNPYALTNKGLVLINLGKHKEALECFNLSIDMGQKIEYAFVGKGLACLELEKYEESEKAYNNALALNDKSVDAMMGLSSVYHRGFFNHTKAAEYTERVLKINPNMINAKANLAEFLLESDNYKKREKLVDEVLKEKPDEYGYPMRLVKVCSLYFRNETNKAIAAAFDLLEYYKSIHNKQILDWDFRGLKNMIKKKEMSSHVKEILLSFISLAETSDESDKINILANLPEKINSTKGFIKSFLNANEVSNVFKKKPQPNIMVRNTATPDSKQPGWYNWEVYLEPQNSLNKVRSVTYTLHKTFPNPVRPVTDRENGFKLQSRGWGEFQVKVDIYFDDDKKMTKYHWLDLGPTPLDKE